MIPFFFLPKLNNLELFLFELIQSLIHLGLVFVLLYLGLFLLFRDKEKVDRKILLESTIFIEIVSVIISFNSIFLYMGAILIFASYILFPLGELVVLYLKYYKKGEISEFKVIFLYLISCVPAFIISIYLADVIFALMGIPDAFMFHYFA